MKSITPKEAASWVILLKRLSKSNFVLEADPVNDMFIPKSTDPVVTELCGDTIAKCNSIAEVDAIVYGWDKQANFLTSLGVDPSLLDRLRQDVLNKKLLSVLKEESL